MPRLNVNLDEVLHRRAKAQAALKGITLREYVENAIAQAVEDDERGNRRASGPGETGAPKRGKNGTP